MHIDWWGQSQAPFVRSPEHTAESEMAMHCWWVVFVFVFLKKPPSNHSGTTVVGIMSGLTLTQNALFKGPHRKWSFSKHLCK